MRGRARGYTFVEVLVTMTIVASALMLLLGVFSPSGKGVQFVQNRVSAENMARLQLEAIQSATYQPNPTAQPYPTVEARSGYQIAVSVSYWDAYANAFVSTPLAEDQGLQMVRVEVSRPGSPTFASEYYKGAR